MSKYYQMLSQGIGSGRTNKKEMNELQANQEEEHNKKEEIFIAVDIKHCYLFS